MTPPYRHGSSYTEHTSLDHKVTLCFLKFDNFVLKFDKSAAQAKLVHGR